MRGDLTISETEADCQRNNEAVFVANCKWLDEHETDPAVTDDQYRIGWTQMQELRAEIGLFAHARLVNSGKVSARFA